MSDYNEQTSGIQEFTFALDVSTLKPVINDFLRLKSLELDTKSEIRFRCVSTRFPYQLQSHQLIMGDCAVEIIGSPVKGTTKLVATPLALDTLEFAEWRELSLSRYRQFVSDLLSHLASFEIYPFASPIQAQLTATNTATNALQIIHISNMVAQLDLPCDLQKANELFQRYIYRAPPYSHQSITHTGENKYSVRMPLQAYTHVGVPLSKHVIRISERKQGTRLTITTTAEQYGQEIENTPKSLAMHSVLINDLMDYLTEMLMLPPLSANQSQPLTSAVTQVESVKAELLPAEKNKSSYAQALTRLRDAANNTDNPTPKRRLKLLEMHNEDSALIEEAKYEVILGKLTKDNFVASRDMLRHDLKFLCDNFGIESKRK